MLRYMLQIEEYAQTKRWSARAIEFDLIALYTRESDLHLIVWVFV